MTHQDEDAPLHSQLWKEREEMFHGSTIRELTSLVDEVLRTHETNGMYCRRGDLNDGLDALRVACRKSRR